MAQVMVPFINGKGGVGKTALACSFAAFLATQSADVTLLDLNEEQRTAVAWSQVRDHNSILPKVRVEAANPRQALERVGRHDYLLVDTPGWTDKTTLSLAKKATFMIIPTGPNATYELAPTVRLLHGLRAEGIEPWRMGVVLSRFSTDDKIRAEEEELARAYLKAERFSEAFIAHHILPMAAAIWSTPVASVLEFPAVAFARFFANHGLLQALEHGR